MICFNFQTKAIADVKYDFISNDNIFLSKLEEGKSTHRQTLIAEITESNVCTLTTTQVTRTMWNRATAMTKLDCNCNGHV